MKKIKKKKKKFEGKPFSLPDPHYSNQAKRMVYHTCRMMKVGQKVRIEGWRFREAFELSTSFDNLRQPPEDRFLESMMGANYGAWTVQKGLLDDYYEISHNEMTDKAVRRDWDRKHIALDA